MTATCLSSSVAGTRICERGWWGGSGTGLPSASQVLAQFSSVQFSSVQLCPTLCDPVDCSTPGLPVHHQLPEFTQTHVHRVDDTIQPPHPLLCPSPPACPVPKGPSSVRCTWKHVFRLRTSVVKNQNLLCSFSPFCEILQATC